MQKMIEKEKMKEIIVITGCSGGIGKATCEYLSGKGYIVYGISRNPNLKKTIPYRIVQLDITDYKAVEKCISRIINETGRIDVLINNAGYPLCGSLIHTDIEDIKHQYEVNLFSGLKIINTIVPHMLKNKKGMIINIGSIGGRIPLPYQSAYSSSKAALMNITDALKIELYKKGINVCLIEPGDTNTGLHAGRIYTDNFNTDITAQRAIDIMHKSEQKGGPPIKVAKTIYKAIKDKKPKQRYIVGLDAMIVDKLNRLLPSKIRRKLIMNMYKI